MAAWAREEDEMEMRAASTYDVFIILPEALPRFTIHRAHFRSLPLFSDGEVLLGVDVWYRRSTDTALVTLRLDPARMTRQIVDRIIDASQIAGLPVLQPERLLGPDRRRFHEVYLAAYECIGRDLPTPDTALRMLARPLGIQTSPPDEEPVAPPPPPVSIRFRRGDGWVLGRLCSLTPQAAYVATSVPPRVGETVDVQLGDGSSSAAATIRVAQVIPPQAARTLGLAGFGGRFIDPETGAASRDVSDLLGILVRATSDGPLVVQPPRRRHVRYPVRVPVSVRFPGTQVVTRALDVSRGGLFVASPVPPALAEVDLELALDGGPAIRLHGRIARTIAEADARSRGVSAGFGVAITRIEGPDVERWANAVDLIGRRASRSVLVVARGARLAELTTELSSVGYLATGLADPTCLDERFKKEIVPDVLVVDSSVDTERPPEAIEKAAARRVAVLYAGVEPATVSRTRVDDVVGLR